MSLTVLLNILIVEDNPGDQFLVTDLLHSSGLSIRNIFFAGTIRESLKVLKEENVDIVLLDLSLPDSHGINSYISVKKCSLSIPVVILSGYTDMALALEAITLGAQDYLIKGDSDEKLLAKTILYSIERMRVEVKLKQSEERKQFEITEAVIAAQENERQYIGRELHDNINQILASTLLYLGLSKRDNKGLDFFTKTAETLITKAITEIRSLSHSMIPPSFSESKLQEAIELLLDSITKTTGIPVHTEFAGLDEDCLPDKLKLTLYRIVQEQLNNIQKYAATENIYVTLIQLNKELTLCIKDDGLGFDTNRVTGGIGLMNIKTRASLLNGKMDIISAPGKGCTLLVNFMIATV